MDKYPFAFGFLESAVHRALRELDGDAPITTAIDRRRLAARNILRGALHDLIHHGIELRWPNDVKEPTDADTP